MKTPTSSAPHICLKVWAKTAGSTLSHFGRTAMDAKTRISNHDTRIEVPATPGAQANTTEPALWLIDEINGAAALKAVYFGSGDHGPVQSVTATTRMMKGARPSHMSLAATCGVDPPLGVAERTGFRGIPP